jgi:putative ABC transport system permease protein
LIISEGMFLAVLGVVLGLAGSAMVTKLVGSFLYGVLPLDLFIYSSVCVSLMIASLIAVYFPARRAMRVDPMAAMRYE